MRKYNQSKVKRELLNNILTESSIKEALEKIEGEKPTMKTIERWRDKDIKFNNDVKTAITYKRKASSFLEDLKASNYDIPKSMRDNKITHYDLGSWIDTYPDFKVLLDRLSKGLDLETDFLSKSVMKKYAYGDKKKESIEIRELANGKKTKKAKKESLEYQASKDLAYINNRIKEDNEVIDSNSSGTITFKIEASGYPIEIDDIKYLMQPDGTLQRFIENN